MELGSGSSLEIKVTLCVEKLVLYVILLVLAFLGR
jgi:hypothetical protein